MKRLLVLVIFSLVSLRPAFAATVLITGANSGIGLEFATTYAARGWDVIATHRRDETPDTLRELIQKYPKVRAEKMDVTDHAQVDALAAKLRGKSIDVLINNAGLLAEHPERQVLGNMDFELFELYLRTNTIGAAKVTEAFAENLVAAKGRVVAISTDMASVSVDDPRRGIYYYYVSKAALNMIMKRMAKELADRGVTTGLIHPGFVRTRDMPRNMTPPPGFPPLVDIDVAVPAMMDLIAKWKIEDTGKFLQYDGQPMPW